MKLTRYEMETVIVFNEEEKTAVVSTFNKRLKRILDKCIEEGDENVTVDSRGDYKCPKSYIRIRPPRKMTEEQKEELKERGKRLWAARQQEQNNK